MTLHWHGGFTSQHEVRRTVGSYRQLSDFKQFESRVRELKTEGYNATEIASIVNQEGFQTPCDGDVHTSASIRKFLTQFGMCGARTASFSWSLSSCMVYFPFVDFLRNFSAEAFFVFFLASTHISLNRRFGEDLTASHPQIQSAKCLCWSF